jgi:hypothetical protein
LDHKRSSALNIAGVGREGPSPTHRN